MFKIHITNRIWDNVKASIDGYSDLIDKCLSRMTQEQCQSILQSLRGSTEQVEACDVYENQVVFWNGKERRIESVEVDNGTILSVEIKFQGDDSVYKFSEEDYFDVMPDNEPEPLVTLEDHGDGGEPGFDSKGVKLFVEANPRWMWIRPEGYGDATSQDGCGAPIVIEYYNGRLRLVVYSDINEQDPQIIDLEDARESNRKEQ